MPDVHLRRIENISEWPPTDGQIRMIEMANERADDGDDENHIGVNTNDDQRKIGNGFIDHRFHPVETHVADPIQLFDAVMQFVEFPEPGNSVQQAMDIPLDEIFEDKENSKLQPQRRALHERKGFRHRQAHFEESSIEMLNELARNDGDNHPHVMAVKYQPEHILPDAISKSFLFHPPGFDPFQNKAKC